VDTQEFGSIVAEVLATPEVVAAIAAMGSVVIGAWLLAAFWAFRDTADRSHSILARYLAATWILLSGPIFMPFAVSIYRLVRPADSADRAEYQRLAQVLQLRDAEAAGCPRCGDRVEPGWHRCPACAAWLTRQCARCERWVPRDSAICPWCTWEPTGSGDPAWTDGPATARGVLLQPRIWRRSAPAIHATMAGDDLDSRHQRYRPPAAARPA
jgi:hypothetical protein